MKSITVTELAARETTPLIDVRERDEFAEGHVPGAVNIPMSEINERIDELPGEAFDVICRSGRVVEALTARGHDATNVDGGTLAWIADGKPVETPSA